MLVFNKEWEGQDDPIGYVQRPYPRLNDIVEAIR